MVFNNLYKGKSVTRDLLDNLGFVINGTSNFMVKYTMGDMSVNIIDADGCAHVFYQYHFIKKYNEGELIYDDLVNLYNLLCK